MPLFGPPNVAKLAARGDTRGLIRALGYGKDHGEMHAAAVEALCQSADARAVEPLIAVLFHGRTDRPTSMAIVVALGRLGDPKAVESLVAVLRGPRGGRAPAADLELAQRDGDVRIAAAHSLVQIGSPAVKPLISVLGDNGGDGRAYAAEALVEIGGPTVEPLIATLGDKARVCRAAAIEVLGRIGDPRAIEPLVAVLDDQKIRTTAVRALKELAWSPDRSTAGAIYWSTMGEWDKVITASHLDRHDEDYQPGCYLPAISHTDQEGFGVDFPL
jgi:HEAT repeat protein